MSQCAGPFEPEFSDDRCGLPPLDVCPPTCQLGLFLACFKDLGDDECLQKVLEKTGFLSVYCTSYANQSCICVENFNLAKYRQTLAEQIIITVIMPIIFTVGLVGNLGVIYTFLRVDFLRTVTNYYLANLASADLLILLTTMPAVFAKYASSPVPEDWYPLGNNSCKMFTYVSEVGSIVSCFTIVIVTVERYFAICWPIRFKIMQRASKAVIICLVTWCYACLYKIPAAFLASISAECIQWRSDVEPANAPSHFALCHQCDVGVFGQALCQRYENFVANFDHMLPVYFLPFLISLYVLIVAKLYHTPVTLTNSFSDNAAKRKRQVIWMLIIAISVYTVCIIPFRIIQIAYYYGYIAEENAETWTQVGRIFTYVNSAGNPIIYNITNRTYRRAFAKAFFHCRGKATKVEPTTGRNSVTYTQQQTVSMSISNVNLNTAHAQPPMPMPKVE